MSVKLMVARSKRTLHVAIVSIALVLVSLVVLILMSGWLLLQLTIVLMAGFLASSLLLSVRVFHRTQEGH
jgi:hypothetical protein